MTINTSPDIIHSMTALSEWQNFCVIVGSSAGALIGLQFVVLTLIAAMSRRVGTAEAGAAFSTPNVVHFGSVLLLAGILSAPWEARCNLVGRAGA
ncbi:MAG: hypothetical protein WCG81_05695 [Candidatus Angelobacter sp.]